MTSTKYYRLTKDYPIWEKGAILSNEENSEKYTPISDVWCRDLDNGKSTEGFWDSASLVENMAEWFERVYPIGDLKKRMFGNRIQARAAADVMYESK